MKILIKRLSIALLLLLAFSTSAQSAEVVLTVSLPQYMLDAINTDAVFTPFYEQNPDIRVVFVPLPDQQANEFILDKPEAYLDDIAQYAQSADVVLVNSRYLSYGGTRAGYFLDLNPLAKADATLDESDYYPAAWNAFSWDNGLWALPINVRLQFLAYNPEVFSELGVNVSNWSTDDFFNITETLYTSGYPVAVGLQLGGGNSLLLRSLYGKAFVANDTPDFANDEGRALIERIAVMRDREYFAIPTGERFDISPLSPSDTSRLIQKFEGEPTQPLPFPNNVIGAVSDGFAISVGTVNPEAAYRVARFLIEDPTFVQLIAADAPAKRNLTEVVYSNAFSDQLDQTAQTFLQSALETALPTSETRFADFVDYALVSQLEYEGALEALLQDVEASAIAALSTAEARAGTYTLVIPTPLLPSPLVEGEIELLFAVRGNSFGLAGYEEQLVSALDEFSATDQTVGRVTLVSSTQIISLDSLDCFVQPTNLTLNTVDASFLQPISPYAQADPAFSEADYLTGTLNPFRANNQLVGLPLTISANRIQYNRDVLSSMGFSFASKRWDITTFEQLLQILSANDVFPIIPVTAGDIMPYLLLSASYGGLPVTFIPDGSIVFDFTSPQSLSGIKQALDLAREGLIGYSSNSGASNIPATAGFPAMFFASPYNFVTAEDVVLEAPYPQGSSYTPVSYGVDGFFITRSTQNPDACYRLYRFLMNERSDLLKAIPAVQSILESETFANAVGGRLAQSYQDYATQLNLPNTVIFPLDFNTGDFATNPIRYRWIVQAFDAYVLEGADFEAEMTELQTKLDSFDACVADVEPVSFSQDNVERFQQYQESVNTCTLTADPEWGTQ